MTITIENLREIVQEPGFLHTLSHIILNEQFFKSREHVKSRNRFEMISHNEVALILSILSENKIDITQPSTAEMERQYARCKFDLEKLHASINNIGPTREIDKFFTSGSSFVEPIFYSASSAFWFDYLEFAPRLYELDRDFLVGEGYAIQEFSDFLRETHNLFPNRFKEIARREYKNFKKGRITASPLESFLLTPGQFAPKHSAVFKPFFDRFAVSPGTMPRVENPLSYHPTKTRPALRLDDETVFAPIPTMLCEQLFENPFYVIAANRTYFSANANNRGVAAERLVADLLRRIPHLEILDDIKLYRRDVVVDQIDAAAVLGATVILFETKTKRLTEAARLGDTEKIINDVRQGILDAQQQLESSKSILLSKSYDRTSALSGNSDRLNEATQIICVSIMTHEIPAYSYIIRTILEKENITGIIPITIFDLKVISRYLNNAFDFLYYFVVRILLAKNLMYESEQALLAFHLKTRLVVPDNYDMMLVDNGYSQFIDADYAPDPETQPKLSINFGIDVVDEIIDQLINFGEPKLFRLFSVFRGMSRDAALEIKKLVRMLERMALKDGQAHDATMVLRKTALTIILGANYEEIQSKARILMYKRDVEEKFEQEYFVFLTPKEVEKRAESKLFRDGISKLSGTYRVVGAAMKLRGPQSDPLIAFSPRIRSDVWDETSETVVQPTARNV